jgi:hypothetical protein
MIMVIKENTLEKLMRLLRMKILMGVGENKDF